MENVTSFLQWEDKISIELQHLYELYGYDRYRMEKFEPYDMYMENKRFINASSVITFYDADGRLMALKPDVTLSVVKNTNPDDKMKKVYYLENVFRMDGRTHEYRELKQIGLEFIGGEGFYPEAETVTMAAKSLAAISENFVLCISSCDIVPHILESHGVAAELREDILAAVRQKNLHRLSELLGDNEKCCELVKKAAVLPENPESALAVLEGICTDGRGREYVSELRRVCGVLKSEGFGDKTVIDLSIINDTGYYNGIAFHGYISGQPGAVLSGGRYDSLMAKMGKEQQALGFAIYIGSLYGYMRDEREYDCDVLLVYGDCDPAEVLSKVRGLTESGKTVIAVAQDGGAYRPREVISI